MGKNQPKKLVLSRETVRDLTRDEMEHVQGGAKNPNTVGRLLSAA